MAAIGASPPVLIEAAAGLALLGGEDLGSKFHHRDTKTQRIIFSIVIASGLTFFGIDGAFWGLIVGGIVLTFARWKRT